MKNILRNACLFIIAIVFTFSFSLNVKADGCDGMDYNHCRMGERGAIKINSSKNIKLNTPHNIKQKVADAKYANVGVNTTPNMTYYHVYKDNYSALFCLDANLDGYTDLYPERFLLHTGVGIVQVYDAAVMSVLTNGGVAKNSSNYADYWARNMAIRALTYTFGFYNGSNVKYASAYYAGLTVAHNWNEHYKYNFDNLNAALASLGMGARVNPAAKSGYNFTGDNVNKAAEYYVKALNDAADYARKLANVPKVENLNPTASEVEENEVSEGNVFVKKDVVHTLKLSKFSKQNNNKFIINSNNNGIKLDGQYDGLTAYISKVEIVGVKTYEAWDIGNILDQDLVQMDAIPENQDVEIKITAHFEGWKSSTNPNVTVLKCGQAPIKYSIDGTYDTGLESQFGNYVGVVWYSDVPNSQRYIGIEERKGDSNFSTPWTSPYETYLIDACSCDDLKNDCVNSGNPNSDVCVELKDSNCPCDYYSALCSLGDNSYCDKYAVDCQASCDTYVETFECCDERGELIVSTLDDHKVSILGPGKNNPDAPSVKLCFVNKVDNIADNNCVGDCKNNANVEGIQDQKGNTYTLASMKQNSYCTVSCKEDYIMTMPTAKLVNAGRYFTFKAKVEGTKVCYTNTIDREKYNKDIAEAQKELVDAYNEYEYWRQAAAISATHDPSSCSDPGCSGGCDSCTPSTAWSCGSCDASGDVVTKSWSFTMYDYNGNSSGNVSNYTAPNGTIYSGSYSDGEAASCGCCSCTGEIGHDPDEDHKANRDEAKKKFEAAQAKYNQIISDYNSCSTWNSEINYNPDVYYDYAENDYMNMLNNHMGEMDKNVSSPTTSAWYCNSNVTSVSGYETRVGQLSDQNYEQCNNYNTGYHETSISYIYCTDNGGCAPKTERISDARYKKVTSGVTANYRPSTLFYNVYPTGEITTSKADDNVALENKLPVALNRERGIYKYTVNIEKLGEFYDSAPKNNLGRYVGSSTAVVDPKTLEYNCSYLVNITKTTGWVCDFDDNCTDDCISNCIGPNCDDYCDGNNCVADCIGLGCIYDSGAGTSLLEKLVSLNSLFPNGTSSYNWDVTKTGKAQATVSEIESKGNAIYEEEPILSLTITPSVARDIRKYNDSVINAGGYSNKTVTCENRGGFGEVVCFSSFIDDLLSGEYGNNVVNANSLIVEDNYRHGDSSEYFTLWPNGVSEEDMIGPAWK